MAILTQDFGSLLNPTGAVTYETINESHTKDTTYTYTIKTGVIVNYLGSGNFNVANILIINNGILTKIDGNTTYNGYYTITYDPTTYTLTIKHITAASMAFTMFKEITST